MKFRLEAPGERAARGALEAAFARVDLDAATSHALALAQILASAHREVAAIGELEYAVAWIMARGATSTRRAPLLGALARLYERVGDTRRAARTWDAVPR